MNALPLLIVQMGTPPASLNIGQQADWFRAALPGHDVIVVRPDLDQALPRPDQFRAAVITGSWSMVTDREDWSERTAQWVRDVLPGGKPMLGVCYGHQLMAHAFGGAVDYHPKGIELGTFRVRRNGSSDALADTLPCEFDAHLTHQQSVLRPPGCAITLAASDHDQQQMLRYGPRAWSTQFHPEFTPALLRTVIESRSHALQEKGHAVDQMLASLRDTPQATALLQRFAALT